MNICNTRADTGSDCKALFHIEKPGLPPFPPSELFPKSLSELSSEEMRDVTEEEMKQRMNDNAKRAKKQKDAFIELVKTHVNTFASNWCRDKITSHYNIQSITTIYSENNMRSGSGSIDINLSGW